MENTSAFPHKTGLCEPQCGMTLRDYFAAAALTGMLMRSVGYKETAEKAYKFADAMMEARAELGEKE